MHTVVSGGWI